MMVDNSLLDVNVHGLCHVDLRNHEARDGEHVFFFQDATITTGGDASVDLVVELLEELRHVLLVRVFLGEDVFECFGAGGRPLGHVSGVFDGAAQFG